jgi:hypothetical protein
MVQIDDGVRDGYDRSQFDAELDARTEAWSLGLQAVK